MAYQSPEKNYVVTVKADVIEVRLTRTGETSFVPRVAIDKILVETNDSGPCGLDVWWIVMAGYRGIRLPLAATGEADFLALAHSLPGLQDSGNELNGERRVRVLVVSIGLGKS